jgi:hypothetical protein
VSELRCGFSGETIPVPLFLELYGYGPFLGRRNRGVRDPIYCRAASFFDGRERALLIISDVVTMDPVAARRIREAVAARAPAAPADILVAGTHTHSAPTISPGIGWGEFNPDFQAAWVDVAIRTALAAARDETPVGVSVGRAPLSKPLGVNRVAPGGPTDPEVRWARFDTPSGRTKLLLHNHGMHAVVFGPKMLRVSADWPGEVARLVLDRKLAENVLFLQGACGNINSAPACCDEAAGDAELRRIGASYVEDLERGLAAGCALTATPVRGRLQRTELPTEPVTPAFLREAAARMRAIAGRAYVIDRLEEMALYMENGGEVSIAADLQTLRLGDIYLYAFPGEPFVELGRAVIERSPGRFAFVAEVANDNGRYLPTPETFAANPELVTAAPGRGYYETQFAGFGRFRARYKPEVGPFVVERLLAAAREMADE